MSQTWEHNDDRFGLSSGDTINPTNSNAEVADLGWIDIDGDEDWTPANRLFVSDPDTVITVVFVQPQSELIEGTWVCRRGYNSNYDCGVIVADGAGASRPNGEGQTIDPVWVWNKDSIPGDSGGSMVAAESVGTDVIYGWAGCARAFKHA